MWASAAILHAEAHMINTYLTVAVSQAGVDARVTVGVLRSQLLTRGAYLSKNFLE